MTSLGYREAIAGLSWPPSANQVLSIVALLLAYVTCLGIYRLYLSPLASIPGPKIAGTHCRRAYWAPSSFPVSNKLAVVALTSLYAGYHDLYRRGQYVWVIEEMHKKYGQFTTIYRSRET
jgi:hypothetical protein